MLLTNKVPKILILIALSLSGQALAHPITNVFNPSAFTKVPKVVDCNLENGEATQCYEFTVPHQPKGLEIGPFCPPTLDDDGGLWDWDGENPGLYRLNSKFFKMVSELGYTFYDENGQVSVVDVRLDRPSNEKKSCLSASADESVKMTLRLPVHPVMAEKATDLGTVAKVGIALDGIPIFADAPSVLDRGHLPALDVCGGHIDPGGWYHWHATATDISTALKTENVKANCTQPQDASAQFAYAFDGFPMYGSLESDGSKPEGLDKCGGHIGLTNFGETYHYHASEEFPNLPACLAGVMAKDNFSTTAAQGIGSNNRGQRGAQAGGRPDFTNIVSELGISASSLMEAMESAGGRDANLADVAKKLNIDEKALQKALPGHSSRPKTESTSPKPNNSAVPSIITPEEAGQRLTQIKAFFADAKVLSGPELVSCTLSGGTKTNCFKITVLSTPQNHALGPWCPGNVSDGPEAGGIWLKDGKALDVDGKFIKSLAELYGDTKWQLFDATTGKVRVTDTLESCSAAARPDVAEEYQNHCVQCLPEYLADDKQMTYVIPLNPAIASEAGRTNRAGSGVAFNGARLDGPAPVDAILGAHTIAAFDDCGGHVNLNVGYHYHAVTDCLDTNKVSSGPAPKEAIATSGHGSQIGIAMDGHQIFGNLMADGSAPSSLDSCNGHQTDKLGYHYHAGEAGSNQILGCFTAEVGCTLNDSDMECDASKRPARRP